MPSTCAVAIVASMKRELVPDGLWRTDRGKAGSKHHLLVDRRGLPLAVLLSAANVHDMRKALPLIDAIATIKGPRGRPRRRPAKGHGDKGYDYAKLRRALRQRHIVPRIARRGIESSERLRRHRWVVERSLSWLHRMKRLRVREELFDDMHLAFLQLACCLILRRHAPCSQRTTACRRASRCSESERMSSFSLIHG